MAMDLQRRSPEYGNWRHHTRYETEPVPNGCVVLVANASTNGGITNALGAEHINRAIKGLLLQMALRQRSQTIVTLAEG